MGVCGSHLSGKASCNPAIAGIAAWRKETVLSMYYRWLDGGSRFLLRQTEFDALVGANEDSSECDGLELDKISISALDRRKLFSLFDPSKSGQIDAYEFMLAAALCSRMETLDKCRFGTILYDFEAQSKPLLDRSNNFAGRFENTIGLTIDEVTMMFRSAVVGASRLDPQVRAMPIEWFEDLAANAFHSASPDKNKRSKGGGSGLDADQGMPRDTLCQFALQHSPIRNFMLYFEQILCKVKIENKSGLWEDKEFPPCSYSLYVNPEHRRMARSAVLISPESVRWCSLSTLAPTQPVLFADSVKSAPMIQGWLANSYFVTVANALLDWPRLLRRLFVGTSQELEGRYCVQFYKNGTWKHVVVDDKVPCDGADRPIYGRCSDMNQVWPMILEKAYAKTHGCYEAISSPSPGCRISYALRDLTGGNPVSLSLLPARTDLRQRQRVWKRLQIAAEKRTHLNSFVRMEWEEDGEIVEEESTRRDRQAFTELGLYSGCLYSIVATHEFEAPPHVKISSSSRRQDERTAKEAGVALMKLKAKKAGERKGKGRRGKNNGADGGEGQTIKLIKLRHTLMGSRTLEHRNWKGDWAADSDNWIYSGALEKLGLNKETISSEEYYEGLFYMTMDEILRNFDTLIECELFGDEWVLRKKRSAWTNFTAGGCPHQSLWTRNEQFALDIKPTRHSSSSSSTSHGEHRSKSRDGNDDGEEENDIVEDVEVCIELAQPETRTHPRHHRDLYLRPNQQDRYSKEYQSTAIGIILAVHDWGSPDELGGER